MKTRPTNHPLTLEQREDLERYNYTHTPGDQSLEETRDAAAEQYAEKIALGKHPSVQHYPNGDEEKYEEQDFLGSFNKGLPRQLGGGSTEALPVKEEFLRFRRATHSANFFVGPDVPKLGTNLTEWRITNKKTTELRGWESPEAGLTMEPHGPDSHSVTMAAAPPLKSEQLAFEMAEVYWLSLLRDTPLTEFSEKPEGIMRCEDQQSTVEDAVKDLNTMAYAKNGFRDEAAEAAGIPSRTRQTHRGELTSATIFRGAARDDVKGPFLSQFLLLGCPTPIVGERCDDIDVIKKGNIAYGAQLISQKLVPHKQCLDHMTDRLSFLDVQEGVDVKGNRFEERARFITTPRDLATFVHFDALYQAYLNACLMLLAFKAPVDPGISYHNRLDPRLTLATDLKNVTQGFALFGGPHILNLVTEVATRGLKAVRYQKFNVHCRLRPEAVAGLIEFDPHGVGSDIGNQLSSNLKDRIRKWNATQNNAANFAMRDGLDPNKVSRSYDRETLLLPMAFPEGSPMHPSYGAGHATVAGACVTVLKAFFDADAVFVKDTRPSPDKVCIISRSDYEANKTRYKPVACVSSPNPNSFGTNLLDVSNTLKEPLSVGGELNKLAANIAIARNMAGVHFYTDYIDSLTMGEEVAIQILKESMSAFPYYPDAVRPSMTIPKFLGGQERISID